MSDQKNILVPIDFSDQSGSALLQACYIAKSQQASLTLLYVIEPNRFIDEVLQATQQEEIQSNIERELVRWADQQKKTFNLKISTLVDKGTIYQKINETARASKASLIIMGSGGEKNSKNKFIGSNTLRVIRESPLPVISIKMKGEKEKLRNVVLPLDLSKETKEKVHIATELAKWTGATVHMVCVTFSQDEFVVNRLTRQMAQVKSQFEKQHIRYTAELIKGIKGEESLSQSILDYAEKVDGDLMVVMTQQEQNPVKYFIGSTAQEMINNAGMPVLSILPLGRKEMVFTPY